MQKLCVSMTIIMLSGCTIVKALVQAAATAVSVASKAITTTAKRPARCRQAT